MNRKTEREVKEFVGIYAKPLVEDARQNLSRKTRGQVRSRSMFVTIRGWLWMTCRVLRGGNDGPY